MNKLIVVIMGPGKKHFAEMCLESVKDADEIYYWTSSKTLFQAGVLLKDKIEYKIFDNEWDESDPATNAKCRNRYLQHLKENHPDDWCLVLDEDEILEEGGIDKIKEFIKTTQDGLYDVTMRHFIGDLGHEDNTVKNHFVPRRLFKISEAEEYPLHSHTVLNGMYIGGFSGTTIWHLGHLPVEYMDYINKRYKQHLNDSKIHTPQFLKQWKLAHLFGQYPTRPINPVELPKQICDRYEIDKDEFYFANRGLETKHFIDAIHWKEFFKCKTAIEFGCGLGPRVYAMNQVGIKAHGVELSKFAVEHKMHKNIDNGDVLDYNEPIGNFDLSIAYDLLEHVNYEDLDKAINTLYTFSDKYIIVSIPFKGDPNLEADPTHIIKEDREWWLKKFTDKGLKEVEVPEHFLFRHQLLIFEK